MIRTKAVILAILLSMFFLRCGTSVDALFIMNLEADFTIQPGLNTFDTHYFLINNVPTRASTYIGQGVTSDQINQVLPNRAELNGRFDAIDWGIVREIEILISTPGNPNNKKEVFYHDRVNFENVNELRLLSSLSEVKDILFEETVDLEVRIRFRATTPIEIDSRLTMNFVVNGK